MGIETPFLIQSIEEEEVQRGIVRVPLMDNPPRASVCCGAEVEERLWCWTCRTCDSMVGRKA